MGDAQPNGRDQRDASGRYLPGHKAQGGRPLGARTRLAEIYCVDLLDVWQRKGKAGLEALADENPAVFSRLVARILPTEIKLENETPFSQLGEQTLETLLRVVELVQHHPAALAQLIDQATTMAPPKVIEHKAADWPDVKAETVARGSPKTD